MALCECFSSVYLAEWIIKNIEQFFNKTSFGYFTNHR